MKLELTSEDLRPECTLDDSAEELYEMAPCGYLTTALDGRIVKANRTFEVWLGYERGELTGGKRFVDLLTVGGRIFFETHFNLLLRVQNAVDEIALDMIRKDGSILPTLINARQKRTVSDQPVLNRFTIFNASERRQYERDLLTARDLLKTTLASIADAVVATDADGLITYTNPVADEICGWKNDAALGKSIDDALVLIQEDTGARIENPITKVLRTGEVVGLVGTSILVSKDGRRIPVDDKASPIRDANGKVIGGVLVFRDISERRYAEKALQDVYEQLERSAVELRRSNEDLSQFAYVASHDLRSPLNTVLQFTQLINREYGPQLGEGKDLLVFVESAARRMNRLIEDLLRYAGVSENNEDCHEYLDVTIPLKQAIENLRTVTEESGAIVTHDAMPAVPADETSLVQIFQNLIGNAIHYRGSDAPRIHIAVKEQSDQWLFSCTDNGVGIPADARSMIFAPFKRLHGSERPGSGIGLAVCKKLVERHKGTIWVESEESRGSTFFFTLSKGTLFKV